MNISRDMGSPRVINADAKDAQLREKLAKYERMEQTYEVKMTVKLIHRCIAELQDAPTYEGEVVQVKILTEDVVRCGECISRNEDDGFLKCTHPCGLKIIDGMSFCSKGVREG